MYRRIARELGIHRETVARYVGLVESKPPKAPLGNGDDGGVPKPASEAPLGALEAGEAATNPCTVGPDLAQLLQGAERSASSSGRSACEPWREVILLKLGVGLSAQRIYQDLTTEHGYAGSYHSVKRFVHKLAGRSPAPFRRLECEPGQEAQVDFGTGAPVVGAAGKRRRTYVFRIVLSHSRKAYSEATFRQTTDDFPRALENAFGHLGGAPRTLVIDNLKAAVQHPDWFDPELVPKVARP